MDMSPEQRLALLVGMFPVVLRTRILGGRGTPRDPAPYLRELRDAVVILLPQGEGTLREIEEYRGGLVEALERVGETPGGTALGCWNHHWQGFADLLDKIEREANDEDDPDDEAPPPETPPDLSEETLAALRKLGLVDATPAAAIPPPIIPRPGQLLDDADELSIDKGDVRRRRLREPLPWGQGGRNLSIHTLAKAESIFFAYEQRFRLLDALVSSARLAPAALHRRVRHVITNGRIGAAFGAFLRDLRYGQQSSAHPIVLVSLALP
jgi:hypothetical protein